MAHLISKRDYEMLMLHLEQIFKLSADYQNESGNRNRALAYFSESVAYISEHSKKAIELLKEINK